MSEGEGGEGGKEGGEGGGNWYDKLPSDMANNPTLQKYASQEEANKGHLELAKTFGSDRMLIPKDANDTEAWAKVNSIRGVPEKADGYNLAAVKAPDGLEGEFDRFKFQEQMKEINADPAQATKLWENYTGMLNDSVAAAQEKLKQDTEDIKSHWMQQWGEAYQTKIDRGQAAIDALSSSQEQKDRLTMIFLKDPDAAAQIGDLMGESSIGGFQEKTNFTMTPDEARVELDKIKKSDDYKSQDDKVRIPAVNRANELMKMVKPEKHQRTAII